ncbi:multiple C2 and transmembrane domain-containing protein 1-like isoform X2 [Bolinopsis microptera]
MPWSNAADRLSDPYCKIKVGLQRARTKVCPKNLNPLWEEKFSFVVETLDETIRFKVMDYDRGFRDDLIGYYEMKLSFFPLDDYQTFAEELTDDSGTEDLGSIKFSIHISSDLSHTPPPDVQEASISSSPPITPPALKKLVRKPTAYDNMVHRFLGGDQKDKPPLNLHDAPPINELGTNSPKLGPGSPKLSPVDCRSLKMDEREVPRSTSPFQEKHLTGILSITLVEASNLRPMNKDGSSDPYCKFKLGHQKHKSKVLRRTLDPVWKERFEIRVYSDSSSILEISVYDYEEFGFSDNFIGSIEVDIVEFEESKTYKKELELEKNGGRLVCIFNLSRIDESSADSSCEISPDDLIDIRKTYAMSYNPLNYLTYKWEDVEDVGVLIVKIIKCIDLPEADTIIGSSDPFCFIEVENTRVRTPTLYKTQDPVWNKQFKFNIKDIHSTLNIRVFDEEKNKYNFLGCVKLPILEAHTIHRCLLKDRKLERVGFGEIFLETELIYNPLRAAIKTLLPAEENLLYEEPKFKRNLFMQNFKRVYALSTVVLSLGLWAQRIYNWENKAKSAIALLLYILVVVSFELYMVPMFAAFVIIYEFLARWVGFKSFETWIMNADLQEQVSKEDEIEDGEDFSLTAKMKMVMGVCQTVQNSLDLVASYCERIKNVFNWTIPFLSFMAASVLISGTVILYFLPLRWLVLAWGINKLTVKLRNPEYEENQELLNFLCRLPSDVELNQMRVITKESSKRGAAINKAVKSRWHK